MQPRPSARVVSRQLLALAWGLAVVLYAPCAGAKDATAPASPDESVSKKGPYKLDELLVVAPPVIEGNQVNRLGSASTVVSERQIEDLNAQDLPQAVRMVPGVVISRFNPVGSFGGGEGGAIFIRGMGSSRPGAEVLTLIDGIPKFVSVWTHPVMDVLNVDIAQSIQVFKGAQPVLYGNMAVAGAVDISPKRRGDPGFGGSLEAAGGSYGEAIEVAQTGGNVSAWDYYLVQSFRRADGHRVNSDGALQNYFGRVNYRLSDSWTTGFLFNASDNFADDPGRIDGLVPAGGRFATTDFFMVANLSNQLENTDGYVKAYANPGSIDWSNQFNATTKQRTDQTLTGYNNYGVRSRQRYRPWHGAEVLGGLDIDAISGSVELVTPPTTQNWPRTTWYIIQPYVALSQEVGSRNGWYAIPSIGVRYFAHTQFENEWGPQGGLIVGYRDTEMHVFYSRGINYPGLFVKAMSDLFIPGDNRWETLNAEVMNHVELGMSRGFTDWARVDFTLFYDEGSGRIVTTTPPPFPPAWTNIGNIRNRGVESTVTVFPLAELSVYAGATYLNSSPSDLPYAPEWSTSFGTNYRFLRDFQISLDGLYLSDYFATSRARSTSAVNTEKIDGYVLLNGKLTYGFKLPRWAVRVQLFLAGENLTDSSYQQKVGYPMPGINGMGGITLTL